MFFSTLLSSPSRLCRRLGGLALSSTLLLGACGAETDLDLAAAAAADLPDVPIGTQQSALLADIKTALNLLEANSPIPATSADVTMGQFDASTGVMTGLVTTYESHYDIELRRLVREPIEATAEVAGVNARLVFRVVNRGSQAFSVTANGQTFTAGAGVTSLAVDVGRARGVSWTIRVGTKAYSDSISLSRPRVLGAGVFTVAALPIGVVYEPPQTGTGRARQTVTRSKTVGTSTTAGSTSEKSTNRPKFVGLAAYQQKLNALKGALRNVGAALNPSLSGWVDNALAAFGTTTITTIAGVTVGTEGTLETTFTDSETVQTSAGLGPGRGDFVSFLKNAEIAWVMVEGQVSFFLMSAESRSPGITVETLKSDLAGLTNRTGLDATSLQGLLALDPFVAGGATASLASPRFVECEPIFGDSNYSRLHSHTVKQSDKVSRTEFKSTARDYKPGWANVLFGINSSAETTTMKTTQTTTNTTTLSDSLTSQIEIPADPSHPYNVKVCWDTLFNNFTVQPPSLTGPIVVAGTVSR